MEVLNIQGCLDFLRTVKNSGNVANVSGTPHVANKAGKEGMVGGMWASSGAGGAAFQPPSGNKQ